MTTKLYLHSSNSGVSGTLPSTEQSSLSPDDVFDALATNRNMNTTIGVSQAILSKSITLQSGLQEFYVSRWVSLPLLDETSISAQTWTINFALANLDVDGNHIGIPYRVYPLVYVWRPSTGAKVGNVNTTYSSQGLNHYQHSTEIVYNQTFSGSSVSCQAGDVLIMELWMTGYTADGSFGPNDFNVYFDGTTENTTDMASASNHASFISTPQDLSFQTVGPTVDATVTSKTITNKFIEIAA